MTSVAGVDSSTQSCKIAICDADSGRLLRSGSAPHPPGTEIDPEYWWQALQSAIRDAGGLDDVAAISVGGQQHGLICLDARGAVIRPALLWNDTRSAGAARDLVDEMGGGDHATGIRRWTDAVGSAPVASLTITKLRWLADHEPAAAARIAAIALPHDWLSWRLRGARSLDDLVTDRSEASGTGYFDPEAGAYRRDLLAMALRCSEAHAREIVLPTVSDPGAPTGTCDPALGRPEMVAGPGCGDNAGAALGLGLRSGEVMLSLGTSGVIAAPAAAPVRDPSGMVAGFADATGGFLPLVCTLNATRILDTTAAVLGVDLDELSALALAAPPGAAGLIQVPYLQGERTPNLPHATGCLYGMTVESMTRENIARAAVESLLCLTAAAAVHVRRGSVPIDRITLVGGGARSAAVCAIAPAVFGVPVDVPAIGEYVAAGAARQAAWVLSSAPQPPVWAPAEVRTFIADPSPELLARYQEAAARSRL
ncbi:FGGY family carbohydrate kinase [Nocardia tengchongensis]|uniref:FGGY family carbohydrate kinase n=1 Tax=Nocardia tengchongensis TaxID=2055889 RepID=UPI003696F4EB